MIITRVRPSIFLASMMALWAIVSTLTAITHDFKGLLLTRFFLGIVGRLMMFSQFHEPVIELTLWYRSAFLSRSTVRLFDILHQEGGCHPNRDSFHRKHLRYGIRGPHRNWRFPNGRRSRTIVCPYSMTHSIHGQGADHSIEAGGGFSSSKESLAFLLRWFLPSFCLMSLETPGG